MEREWGVQEDIFHTQVHVGMLLCPLESSQTPLAGVHAVLRLLPANPRGWRLRGHPICICRVSHRHLCLPLLAVLLEVPGDVARLWAPAVHDALLFQVSKEAVDGVAGAANCLRVPVECAALDAQQGHNFVVVLIGERPSLDQPGTSPLPTAAMERQLGPATRASLCEVVRDCEVSVPTPAGPSADAGSQRGSASPYASPPYGLGPRACAVLRTARWD